MQNKRSDNIRLAYNLLSKMTKYMQHEDFENILKKFQNLNISIERIFAAGSEFFNIKLKVLLSKSRIQQISLPRHCIRAACIIFGHTLSATGIITGHDHSTVIHSLKLIKNEKMLTEKTAQLLTFIMKNYE